jgi:hypothetical protein
MSEPNLVKYLPRLTTNEKAVLLKFLRDHSDEKHYHEGTLPFVSKRKAIDAIKHLPKCNFIGDEYRAYQRIAGGILTKLNSPPDGHNGNAIFFMRLNPKKVHRQFGAHPEKGKPLNFLPKEKVTVGVKFSLPKKAWVPDNNVLVAPSVALKKRGDLWEVTVMERCRDRVEAWLQQNCA